VYSFITKNNGEVWPTKHHYLINQSISTATLFVNATTLLVPVPVTNQPQQNFLDQHMKLSESVSSPTFTCEPYCKSVNKSTQVQSINRQCDFKSTGNVIYIVTEDIINQSNHGSKNSICRQINITN
jgi:hypothetical protein